MKDLITVHTPQGGSILTKVLLVDAVGALYRPSELLARRVTGLAQGMASRISSNSLELFSWRNRIMRFLGLDTDSGRLSEDAAISKLCTDELEVAIVGLLNSAGDFRLKGIQFADLFSNSLRETIELDRNLPQELFTSDVSNKLCSFVQLGGKILPLDRACSLTLQQFPLSTNQTTNLELHLNRPTKETFLLKDYEPEYILFASGHSGNLARAALCGLKTLALTENSPMVHADLVAPSWSPISLAQADTPKTNFTKHPVASTSSPSLLLQCDGASRGNPGSAAIGFVIYSLDEPRKKLVEVGLAIGVSTNNYAEHFALFQGLQHCLKLCPSVINVELDSNLVVEQIKGNFKVKASNLIPLVQKTQNLLSTFTGKFSIRYIPRAQNSTADALCNAALDSQEVR